jgi:hypothetical protein
VSDGGLLQQGRLVERLPVAARDGITVTWPSAMAARAGIGGAKRMALASPSCAACARSVCSSGPPPTSVGGARRAGATQRGDGVDQHVTGARALSPFTLNSRWRSVLKHRLRALKSYAAIIFPHVGTARGARSAIDYRVDRLARVHRTAGVVPSAGPR